MEGTKLPNIHISCRYLVELGARQLGLLASDDVQNSFVLWPKSEIDRLEMA